MIIASAAGRRQGEKRFKVILGNTETTGKPGLCENLLKERESGERKSQSGKEGGERKSKSGKEGGGRKKKGKGGKGREKMKRELRKRVKKSKEITE